MRDLVRLRVVCYVFLLRVLRALRHHLGLEKTTYVDDRLGEYRAYWEQAASALAAEFEPLSESIWEVRRGGARTRIALHATELDSPATLELAGDKALIYRMAQAEGIPVPNHVVVSLDTLRMSLGFLASTGGPCVVKPARNSGSGIGVTTYVFGRRELERAIARASIFCPDIIVESVVPGESYRLLFLDGQMIHAVRRRGTRIVGDGTGTIRARVAQEYGAPIDRIADATLRLQGLSADTVLSDGATALVRGLPPAEKRRHELRTVYDEDVTELMGASLVAQLRPLVSLVGASFAGVDIVTVDPTTSLDQAGAALLELNTTPGLHHHNVGGSFTVAQDVLRHLLDRSRQQRPPASTPAATGSLEAGP